MSNPSSAEEIVRYEKDRERRIATITFSRPGKGNALTVDARLRFADLIHRADIDDDVKVLVIRGEGDDLGTGVDGPDSEQSLVGDDARRLREFGLSTDDVTAPPRETYRNHGAISTWFTDARSGVRSLQDFSKISILEAKGYCYGWHFYLAADADLVIASDDALFGDPAFRETGWAPRMWTWANMMGIRRFQEMVFTGRPFTAAEMYDCNFLNRVVPRDQLDAEVAKYADACSRTRPTDGVHIQKSLFKSMKQHQGEYMGSIMTGLVSSMAPMVRPDRRWSADGEQLPPEESAESPLPPRFRLDREDRAQA